MAVRVYRTAIIRLLPVAAWITCIWSSVYLGGGRARPAPVTDQPASSIHGVGAATARLLYAGGFSRSGPAFGGRDEACAQGVGAEPVGRVIDPTPPDRSASPLHRSSVKFYEQVPRARPLDTMIATPRARLTMTRQWLDLADPRFKNIMTAWPGVTTPVTTTSTGSGTTR